MISLLCLISQRSQVQEGNHSSMWAISLGPPAKEIAHFERIGLDGFSSNFLILTREQAFRGREGNSLSMHAYYHTLAHSLFSLFGSFFSFQVFSLSLSLSLLNLFISCAFLPFFLCSPLFSLVLPLFCLYYAQLRPSFIAPAVMGFYCFAP